MPTNEEQNVSWISSLALERAASDILTLERAANILDCSLRTLGDKIRSKEIRAYKRLNRWYLLRSDLELWIRNGESSATRKNVKKSK